MLQRVRGQDYQCTEVFGRHLSTTPYLGEAITPKNCSWPAIVRELQMSPSVMTIDSKVIQLSMIIQFNTWTFWEIKEVCTSVSRSIDE